MENVGFNKALVTELQKFAEIIALDGASIFDIIQEECSVRFTLSFHAHWAQIQRVNQNMIVTSPRTISEVVSSNICSLIFRLDARAVKLFRSCLADFILVDFYSLKYPGKLKKLVFNYNVKEPR